MPLPVVRFDCGSIPWKPLMAWWTTPWAESADLLVRGQLLYSGSTGRRGR